MQVPTGVEVTPNWLELEPVHPVLMLLVSRPPAAVLTSQETLEFAA